MIAVTEIFDFLGSEVVHISGNMLNLYVKHLKPVEEVDKETLDWIGRLKTDKQNMAEQSKAKVILCDTTVVYSEKIASQGKVLIHVKNPKLALSLVIDKFFIQKILPGIHPSSTIHPEAKIAPSAYIGSNCSIGKCTIGERAKIFPNVTIYDDVIIGNDVILQAGSVIGTDGLGCERKDDGSLVKFPHLGGVRIGDNVEIGANCQIAKGALSNTIIGDGCKINGLCAIAHSCILGKNVWISVSTTIAGSVRIGDNSTIFSQVVVRDQLAIGQGVTLGMGAVVTKNVPSGEIWVGNPARRFEK